MLMKQLRASLDLEVRKKHERDELKAIAAANLVAVIGREPLRIRQVGRSWLVEFRPERSRRWIVARRHRSKIAAQADLIACLPVTA